MLLNLLQQSLAVVRLDPGNSIPGWATTGSFCSITITPEELSIFCDSAVVPGDVEKVDGWRAFQVAGQIGLELSGIIAQLAVPLSAKQIPIFSISTHDTDYILAREDQLADATDVLKRAGHSIRIP
ncbi:MAG: ACT domain-containing protein [Opitutales bacterium]|jgi:hypothetical protein